MGVVFIHVMLAPPTFSFLLALNFFRHSTVSCLCIQDATVERCWEDENTSSSSSSCQDEGESLWAYIRGSHWDPRMFEGLCSCDALCRINGQHLINEIFGFRSHRVPLRRRELGHNESNRWGVRWHRSEVRWHRGGVRWHSSGDTGEESGDTGEESGDTGEESGDTVQVTQVRSQVTQVRGQVTYIISSSFNLLVETMLIFIPEWRITDQ